MTPRTRGPVDIGVRVEAPTTQVQSKSIVLNNGTINQATLITTHTGTINFFLTADGGDEEGGTWEAVTPDATHTFSNTGEDLRWKAEGEGGAEISYLQVDYAFS